MYVLCVRNCIQYMQRVLLFFSQFPVRKLETEIHVSSICLLHISRQDIVPTMRRYGEKIGPGTRWKRSLYRF